MSERVVAIIQARMGSTRFPKKMMADLCGQPVLGWVLNRTKRARRLDETVVATTASPQDDAIGDFSRSASIKVFRGDENDVLGRFVEAAREFSADVVVRICADNPLIAPEEIDRVVGSFLEQKPDYAFNHVPRKNNGYPDGLGAEVFSRQLLEDLSCKTSLPHHREHVTSYIWDHEDHFNILAVSCPPELKSPLPVKLDVDTHEDLERLRSLVAKDISFSSSAREIVQSWCALYG